MEHGIFITERQTVGTIGQRSWSTDRTLEGLDMQCSSQRIFDFWKCDVYTLDVSVSSVLRFPPARRHALNLVDEV